MKLFQYQIVKSKPPPLEDSSVRKIANSPGGGFNMTFSVPYHLIGKKVPGGGFRPCRSRGGVLDFANQMVRKFRAFGANQFLTD